MRVIQGDVMVNIKNGTEYIIASSKVINCTNAVDGQEMVAYYNDDGFYVREISEFFDKFRPLIGEMQ